ncbi:MAG TPA: nuclear transport factor 2 family protein [Pseudonocardiaceae bacterium]|jgi:ketosteroid isomerase-like protein|nr:nuclear transport factor 2 family protein [Pseudonocardiaceae bacterium]
MNVTEIVTRYYELANQGDWDAWCDLFAPDQVMDEQLAGHVEGRETLRDMMRGFPDMYSMFANVPRHVVVDGDKAAVVSRLTAVTPAGVTIQANVCNYYEITDGQISYMANFHDTAPFASVLAK